MNYDTTRKFSRSCSEAFADERAKCIEGPGRSKAPYRAVGITVFLAYVFLVVLGVCS